jgi:hypothetical protein
MKRLAAIAIATIVVALTSGEAAAQRNRWGRIDPTPGATTPVIQLLTFGRGAVIFEKFGHTAMCIDYQEPGRETICFNYGVTNFDMDPVDLTWAFIRGRQKFWVEPVGMGAMVAFYRGEDRTIEVQSLPLPPEQARLIEKRLIDDVSKPDYYYFYDHFADNCTTRLRDMIDEASGGKLREGSGATYPYTYRQLGRSGMAEFPVLISFGDFAVGRALDRDITRWDAMFHPFVLRDEVTKKLGAAPVVLYERRQPPIPSDGPTGRGWALFIGFLFALPLLVSRVIGRFERAAVAVAAVPLALMGIIIWTAAIVSTIPGLRWNEALFLYVPFDIAYPFLGEERRRQYARVRLAMVVVASFLCAVGLFLQPLWVPIVIGFALHGLIAMDPRTLPRLWRRS